jgi:hypothetical protein
MRCGLRWPETMCIKSETTTTPCRRDAGAGWWQNEDCGYYSYDVVELYSADFSK